MTKKSKWFVVLSIAATLAVGGIAAAATTDNKGCKCDGFQGGKHNKHEFKQEMRQQFKAEQERLMELLKMNRDAYRAERQAGKTLGAIAAQQGVSEQDLTNFFTARMTERLAEGIKNGRITEERAATIKTAMPDRIAAMIKGERPMRQGAGHPHRSGQGPQCTTQQK